MTHYDLLQKLISIVGGFFYEELFIDSDYVMTADNFLKMLLIIIRARCNIPIVIMGETGCGKTSLVRFLATRILNEGFEVINFHAGIKESQILEKMNEIKMKAYELIDGKIWVFLDEINTCDHLGLITEIMTQNSLMGEPLPFNIVFIAACNPYKIRNFNSDVGLIKQRVATQLVYRVHPLPDSLLDYVWDYGSLTENEEVLYINNILRNISGELKEKVISLVVRSQIFIRDCEDKYSVSLRDVSRFKILHEWFYKIIEEKNEKEEISLDISKSEKNLKSSIGFSYIPFLNFGSYSSKIKYTGKLMVARKALILSLFLCYYNRISHTQNRAEYKKIIIRSLLISEKDLEEMIYEEQKDIVTRMELPPAIAINKALLENVFTLMVCVINKIPLFICGKPGCSKSLAVQLLVSNLRGQDSTDNFFKTLPRILAIPYQGSESSTSEGIEKIFQKAHNVLKNADQSILPLIVFDEIGLAEISKNNPLKVLHSLLEPDNPVIAFVGISNWRLDASKMNRAIYLARPDPDLEDLESTALSIFEYYNKEPRFDEKAIMKALAKTYFEFKREQCNQGYSDFHGTRDFYSLIKQVTKKFSERINEYNDVKYSIVKNAFNRNFGGLNNSINSIHKLFARNMGLFQSEFDEINQISLMELVRENLKDKDSRFLLLFTNGESASYILDNYLKNDLKERVFLMGSEFEGDKNKDEHSFRLLSDIILYMESGSSVILKNLDQIYGSLYDLFNQNFMIVGNKKNCRIALGSTNNPMCFVHDNFHCVVLVDIKNLNRMDPPFLNRFEKQVLTFDSILTERHRMIVKELTTWIDSITKIAKINQDESSKNSVLSVSDLIVSYNEEFCPSLALLHYNDDKSIEEIIQKCKYDIISVSNINFIIFSVLSQMYQNSRDEVINCHQIFFDHQNHDSLSQYISNSYFKNLHNESLRLIVFTYSNILEEIKFFNLNLPNETETTTSIINVAEIKTDKEFDHRFKIFLNNKESEWLLIKINAFNENSHIPMIKFKAEKFLNEYKKNLSSYDQYKKLNKNVIIIVYLSKIKKKLEKTDEKDLQIQINKNHIESHFLSGWNQITIDCLNGGQINKLKKLLNFSTIEVIKSNLDKKTISEIIFNIYLKFNFSPYNYKDSKYIKHYMTDIIRKIETDSEIFDILTNKCLEYLSEPKKKLLDWKIKICCDQKIIHKSMNTYDAIKLFVADILEEPLLKIIHFLETESALNSFFLESDEKNKLKLVKFSIISNDEILKENVVSTLRTVWKDIFSRKDISQIYPYSVIQSMLINPVLNLNFPFSRSEIFNISLLIKDSIENIRILEAQGEAFDINQIYEAELENVKKILKSSTLFKIISDLNYNLTPSQERSLQLIYISDILTFYITVELKIPSVWKDCLGILCEKYFSFENENIATIFVFLWKNRKILNSIFDLMEEMLSYSSGKKKDVFILEEIFKKPDIYQKNSSDNNKRINEIKLFNSIFRELSIVLLMYLHDLEKFNSITNSYASILNKFISTLTDFTLETKIRPEILDLLVIINESLKVLSFIFNNNSEEIAIRVYDLFLENKDNVTSNDKISYLTDYSFISNLLTIIDMEVKIKYNKIYKQSEASMEIDDVIQIKEISLNKNNNLDNSLDELNVKIVNSKLVIFECAINKEISEEIKGVIISNILKDPTLIKYSSMVFNKLFSDIKIDESFEDVLNNFKLKNLIENCINKNNINSFDHIFFSFLSDFIRKFLSKPTKKMEDLNELLQHIMYLDKNYENYSNYWVLINSQSKFENILGFAGLKHYLEIYGDYVAETLKFQKDPDLIIKINKHLEKNLSTSNEVIRNYLIKSLMKKLGCTASSLSRLNFNEMGINWMSNKLFENTDNILGLSVNFTGLDSEYDKCSNIIVNLIHEDKDENLNHFREILKANSLQNKDKKAFEIRLSIVQFFINKIYLSFSNPKFTESLTYNQIVIIFEKIKDDLKESLGEQSCIFIKNLVYNFSKDKTSFFKIDSKMDLSKIGIFAIIMQVFNLLISSTNNKTNIFPYLQIFKNQTDNYSTLINSLDNLKSNFIPGGFPDTQDDTILDKIKHVNENFEVYGTQLGLYECSCGYLYTIGDCTKPYYLGDCPSCKQKIGGLGHVLQAREGHICLINADNRNDANRKQLTIEHLIKKLKNSPGYHSKMSDEISLQYSIRGLSAVGFRFFNFINNSIMYILIELGIIKDKDFLKFLPNNKIKNYSGVEYLKSHLPSDMTKLGELLKVKESYIFMMLVLSDIEAFISSNFENKNISFNLKSFSDRENYENFIQSNFITPKLDKIHAEIQEYKTKYSLDKNISFSKILEESFNEKQIANLPCKEYMRIFRITKIGNWEDLKSEFLKMSLASSSNQKRNHQFMKIIIQRFEDFILLSNLYPIVSFTNYMLNLCNYRLSRQEAKEKTINDIIQGDSIAEKLFLEFSKAWENISHRCTQYSCKNLPPLKKINREMPISFVLLDDRELGYGMYMASALQQLGQIQNEVMEAIVYLIKEDTSYQLWSNVDINKYPIQKFSPHEIIMHETNVECIYSMTNNLAKFYDIYNPNFGQGSSVLYNFEKIEQELATTLLTNKKMLNYEDLSKIQYKFELLSINNKNSNLLNDIKSKVIQKSFSPDEKNILTKTLEKIESQNVAYLHQLFSSMEIILCNLRYTSILDNSIDFQNTSISNYISKIPNTEKISSLLKESEPLCSIKLKNIISFYEIIEGKIFNHILEYISPEYKLDLGKDANTLLNKFFSFEIISFDKLIRIIQRFIIRCLVAFIEPKFPIKEYLIRSDFWDIDTNEEIIDKFYDRFPEEILIANSLPLLDYITECKNKLEKQKSENNFIDINYNHYAQARMELEKRKSKFN
jgi:nucleoside-triphosphatase THEP1